MAFVPVTYGNGVPVLSSGGSQRVACAHLAEWLKVYDALQAFRKRGHVTYYQTMGGADASAGTHMCGSAWDMAYTSDAAIMDAREMGAAVWHRTPGYNGWPSSGANHVHGLILCGDNACNGYQYNAYWNGYNGLGLNGVGAGDPLPKPSKRRTWQEGIVWAKLQMNSSASKLTNTEDDMPIFMRTTDTSIWALTPGQPPRGLNGQQWTLWVRLGASLLGGDFNRAEVDIINAMIQPNAVAPAPVTATVDMAAITAAIKDAVQSIDALTDADADLIASKVRAKIIKD